MKLVAFKNKHIKSFGVFIENKGIIATNETLMNATKFEDILAGQCQSLDQEIDGSSVTLLAPLLPTKNIICIGKNYHDHILEFDGTDELIQEIKENPIFFTKALSSVCGPMEPIRIPTHVTSEVDYEGELGIVIGKTCYHISPDQAQDYIFGYTIINDVTARDLQRKHKQWFLGKGLDTFCPAGPYIVTKDEIENPQNLKIQTKVNGEVRQDESTDKMIHTIKAQISFLSKMMTLNPGDVIATGTPKGVGMGFEKPKFLKEGDLVEVSIEGIGILKNHVSELK